jgi:hypothetical protein
MDDATMVRNGLVRLTQMECRQAPSATPGAVAAFIEIDLPGVRAAFLREPQLVARLVALLRDPGRHFASVPPVSQLKDIVLYASRVLLMLVNRPLTADSQPMVQAFLDADILPAIREACATQRAIQPDAATPSDLLGYLLGVVSGLLYPQHAPLFLKFKAEGMFPWTIEAIESCRRAPNWNRWNGIFVCLSTMYGMLAVERPTIEETRRVVHIAKQWSASRRNVSAPGTAAELQLLSLLRACRLCGPESAEWKLCCEADFSAFITELLRSPVREPRIGVYTLLECFAATSALFAPYWSAHHEGLYLRDIHSTSLTEKETEAIVRFVCRAMQFTNVRVKLGTTALFRRMLHIHAAHPASQPFIATMCATSFMYGAPATVDALLEAGMLRVILSCLESDGAKDADAFTAQGKVQLFTVIMTRIGAAAPIDLAEGAAAEGAAAEGAAAEGAAAEGAAAEGAATEGAAAEGAATEGAAAEGAAAEGAATEGAAAEGAAAPTNLAAGAAVPTNPAAREAVTVNTVAPTASAGGVVGTLFHAMRKPEITQLLTQWSFGRAHTVLGAQASKLLAALWGGHPH